MNESVNQTLRTLLEQNAFSSFKDCPVSVESPCHLSGLEGSSLSGLIASTHINAKETSESVLVVMRSAKTAEMLCDDLKGWLGEEAVLYFPALDLKPYEWRAPFGQILEQRLHCYFHLIKSSPVVVVTTQEALLMKLNPPQYLNREVITLSKGQEISLSDMRETLNHLGFVEETVVEDMGQFSIRGGLLDIYPFLLDNPVRIEFFGDEIESIREFDIFSQRSIDKRTDIEIIPFDECCFSISQLEEGLLNVEDKFSEPATFEAELERLTNRMDRTGIYWQRPFFSPEPNSILNYFSKKPLVVLEDWQNMAKTSEKLHHEMEKSYQSAREKGLAVASPEALFYKHIDMDNLLQTHPRWYLTPLEIPLPGYISFHTSAQSNGGGSLNAVQSAFDELAEDGFRIYITAPNNGQAERLKKVAINMPIQDVLVGELTCGFVHHTDKVAIFTDHQIFNRFTRRTRYRKFRGGGISIPNFEALNRHDLIVHQDYGIGKFLGIKRIRVEDHAVDCILLSYKGNDRLTIPVTDLRKIQKYASKEEDVPTLSKLGGKQWEATKQRAKKAILKLAKDLIELYAKRTSIQGYAFSQSNEMQEEFNAQFEYIPTPDQQKAFADVNKDMEEPKPMDRLICGDVGFGKTEVAMRAAFKAVADKKQVAILAPTTLLVSQHHASFIDRFSNWPVNIEFLNRFKSAADAKAIIKKVREGTLDIIIGTHRLISKDIIFKNLGLIIVDEEQKFGVQQKEKLKKLRSNVDVISMSATPIPRSLHMSLVGARDFSTILTPPRNRVPIDTRVVKNRPELLIEAMERELNRGGQVFFVHNRVRDLTEITLRVEELMPEARVGMAHGRLAEKDLEQVMLAFIHRQYDILVTTSIIESGIDLPNVNTIIVNNAHFFGLSQLFQMRGRVGRSATQAYCLLIAPEDSKFSIDAQKRLYSLQKFTELGSGYQLAMRDLEIRGAGNILGMQQSGHIHAIGYDIYCRLLKETVLELQNQEVIPPLEPEIDFAYNAFIPEDYVEDGLQRISLYQKISRSNKITEIDDIAAELKDRFGPIPEPTDVLLKSMKTRVAAQTLGLQKVILKPGILTLTFAEYKQPTPDALGQMAEKIKTNFRFINETPLRVVIHLKKGTKPVQIQEACFLLQELL